MAYGRCRKQPSYGIDYHIQHKDTVLHIQQCGLQFEILQHLHRQDNPFHRRSQVHQIQQ